MCIENSLRPQVSLASLATWGVGGLARWLWPWDPERIDAGLASTSMPQLALATTQSGYQGIEWMTAVPGSVGGGVVINCSVGSLANAAMEDHLSEAEFVGSDGQWQMMSPAEMAYSHRCSVWLERSVLCVRATFRLGQATDLQSPLQQTQELLQRRRKRQPLNKPSAGSTFRAPPKATAGLLLKATGVHGMVQGCARVSPCHCNWVEASLGCRSVDIRDLTLRMRSAMYEHSGYYCLRCVAVPTKGGEYVNHDL